MKFGVTLFPVGLYYMNNNNLEEKTGCIHICIIYYDVVSALYLSKEKFASTWLELPNNILKLHFNILSINSLPEKIKNDENIENLKIKTRKSRLQAFNDASFDSKGLSNQSNKLISDFCVTVSDKSTYETSCLNGVFNHLTPKIKQVLFDALVRMLDCYSYVDSKEFFSVLQYVSAISDTNLRSASFIRFYLTISRYEEFVNNNFHKALYFAMEAFAESLFLLKTNETLNNQSANSGWNFTTSLLTLRSYTRYANSSYEGFAISYSETIDEWNTLLSQIKSFSESRNIFIITSLLNTSLESLCRLLSQNRNGRKIVESLNSYFKSILHRFVYHHKIHNYLHIYTLNLFNIFKENSSNELSIFELEHAKEGTKSLIYNQEYLKIKNLCNIYTILKLIDNAWYTPIYINSSLCNVYIPNRKIIEKSIYSIYDKFLSIFVCNNNKLSQLNVKRMIFKYIQNALDEEFDISKIEPTNAVLSLCDDISTHVQNIPHIIDSNIANIINANESFYTYLFDNNIKINKSCNSLIIKYYCMYLILVLMNSHYNYLKKFEISILSLNISNREIMSLCVSMLSKYLRPISLIIYHANNTSKLLLKFNNDISSCIQHLTTHPILNTSFITNHYCRFRSKHSETPVKTAITVFQKEFEDIYHRNTDSKDGKVKDIIASYPCNWSILYIQSVDTEFVCWRYIPMCFLSKIFPNDTCSKLNGWWIRIRHRTNDSIKYYMSKLKHIMRENVLSAKSTENLSHIDINAWWNKRFEVEKEFLHWINEFENSELFVSVMPWTLGWPNIMEEQLESLFDIIIPKIIEFGESLYSKFRKHYIENSYLLVYLGFRYILHESYASVYKNLLIQICSKWNHQYNGAKLWELYEKTVLSFIRNKIPNTNTRKSVRQPKSISRTYSSTSVSRKNKSALKRSSSVNLENCTAESTLFSPTVYFFESENITCHRIPWDSFNFTQKDTITWGIDSNVFYHLYNKWNLTRQNFDSESIFYVLNPSNDLPLTENAVPQPILESKHAIGVKNKFPDTATLLSNWYNKSIYLYCGHQGGAQYIKPETLSLGLSYKVNIPDSLSFKCIAILMGCSSIQFDYGLDGYVNSLALNFLSGGSPYVIGLLWDVTDGDLNRFTHALLDNSHKNYTKWQVYTQARTKSRAFTSLPCITGNACVSVGLPL